MCLKLDSSHLFNPGNSSAASILQIAYLGMNNIHNFNFITECTFLWLCLNTEGKETSVGIHYSVIYRKVRHLKTKVCVYIRWAFNTEYYQTKAKMQLYVNISALDLAKIVCFRAAYKSSDFVYEFINIYWGRM
jgi:hypothetical protein